jgi:hypothetical protein
MQPVRTTIATIAIVAASGFMLLVPAAGLAQVPDGLEDMTPEQRREYVQSLSGEERQALKKQLRARWDGMSEEERAAARAKRDSRKQKQREQWDNMSAEEKEAARQRRPGNRDPQGQRQQ